LSTSNEYASDAGDGLDTASYAVTVTEYEPSARSPLREMAPSESTEQVGMVAGVPVMVHMYDDTASVSVAVKPGWRLLVTPSLPRVPPSIDGWAGPAVSTVQLRLTGSAALPATSVVLTVSV